MEAADKKSDRDTRKGGQKNEPKIASVWSLRPLWVRMGIGRMPRGPSSLVPSAEPVRVRAFLSSLLGAKKNPTPPPKFFGNQKNNIQKEAGTAGPHPKKNLEPEGVSLIRKLVRRLFRFASRR